MQDEIKIKMVEYAIELLKQNKEKEQVEFEKMNKMLIMTLERFKQSDNFKRYKKRYNWKDEPEPIYVTEFAKSYVRPRLDLSNIHKYRPFLKLCLNYDIPRRFILETLKDVDDRFNENYKVTYINRYCCVHFVRTKIV